jgi:hypothetical protein
METRSWAASGIPHVLAIGRRGADGGVGRPRAAISEVGAILIVGSNIAGYTRTMTTAIALRVVKATLPSLSHSGACSS